MLRWTTCSHAPPRRRPLATLMLLAGLLAVLLASLLPATSTPARAAVPSSLCVASRDSRRGIQFGAPFNARGELKLDPAAIELVECSGAQWMRLNIIDSWQHGRSSPAFLRDQYCALVQRLTEKNIQVIGLLTNEFLYNPNWTDPAYHQRFAAKAGELAALFAPRPENRCGSIRYWQIWNEPNGGVTPLEPALFANLLIRTHAAIKGRAPDTITISGGLDLDGPVAYINAVKAAAGGQLPTDAAGLHSYVSGVVPLRTIVGIVRSFKEVVGKDIYMTEIGSPIGPYIYQGRNIGVSEAQQAANLQSMYTQLGGLIKVGIWFYLVDEAGLPFGLVRADQSFKPAWCAFIGKDWRSVPECKSRTTPRIRGTGEIEQNELIIGEIPPQVDLTIERRRQTVPDTPWEAIESIRIDGPTYTYVDALVEPNVTYCYRARYADPVFASPYSSEICLTPTPAPYPYRIAAVETSPTNFPYPGLKDLTALFDGKTTPPDYALINYTPGPVTITLTFREPVTLAGFSAVNTGWVGYRAGYRWTVEADPDGTGTFQTVIPSFFADAGAVSIAFPAPTTARVFRVIHERSPGAGDEVEHILELAPIFAPS